VEVLDAANQGSEAKDEVIPLELSGIHRSNVFDLETKIWVSIEIVLDVSVLRKIVDDGNVIAPV
jgi:hypothetical protein